MSYFFKRGSQHVQNVITFKIGKNWKRFNDLVKGMFQNVNFLGNDSVNPNHC